MTRAAPNAAQLHHATWKRAWVRGACGLIAVVCLGSLTYELTFSAQRLAPAPAAPEAAAAAANAGRQCRAAGRLDLTISFGCLSASIHVMLELLETWCSSLCCLRPACVITQLKRNPHGPTRRCPAQWLTASAFIGHCTRAHRGTGLRHRHRVLTQAQMPAMHSRRFPSGVCCNAMQGCLAKKQGHQARVFMTGKSCRPLPVRSSGPATVQIA